ncbi:hypothetical protein [Porphyromonas sp.]|uniref:hypothetical protein n=1 Tax=Porphyromonas sp. TaxID=1924944 RepID=UPI0026DB7A16|nr:hypothetical protein [Porphyromonas sp.]MDO4695747.1 hypothetical protein [Porphyromonas sp.]MDO4771768.1 hypothetical protein [Porphyromonas sp.]
MLYRPYAYAHLEIKEGLSIANNYPSFSAVLVGYLAFKIYYAVKAKGNYINSIGKKYYLLSIVLLGNYLYEGLDIYLGKGDWWDMIAITFGGIFIIPFIYFRNKKP